MKVIVHKDESMNLDAVGFFGFHDDLRENWRALLQRKVEPISIVTSAGDMIGVLVCVDKGFSWHAERRYKARARLKGFQIPSLADSVRQSTWCFCKR